MSVVQQEVPRRWRRFSEKCQRKAVRLIVEEGYMFKAAVGDQSLPADNRHLTDFRVSERCEYHVERTHDIIFSTVLFFGLPD